MILKQFSDEPINALQRLDLNADITKESLNPPKTSKLNEVFRSLTKRDVSESLVFPMSLGVGHRENIAHVGFDYSDKINIQGWMKKQSGSEIFTRFQSRYFVLWDSQVLYYFAKKDDTNYFSMELEMLLREGRSFVSCRVQGV